MNFSLRRHIVIVSAALLLGAPGVALAVPGFAEVQQSFRSSDASMFDRHGELIQQLRLNPNERRLSWIALEDISPALRNALIASEDRRFYQHSGVDWNAVAASAWGNLWNTKTRGASTITMQLAGLIYDDLRRKSSARSMTQKVSQVFIAQSLERNWRKDQILEAYLNLVSFRGELVGVHALSRVLFGKHPSGLNQSEAAIAVALIRAPNAKPTKVSERACVILKEQQAPQECNGLQGRTELVLARATAKGEVSGAATAPQLAPHLGRKLLKDAGKPVYSTIDAATQRFASDALRRQLSALVERNIEDGAVVVIDNASGDVLAWVGSSGSLSGAAQVDGVQALRQAGSTLKPFLYELAIEKKWLTAASLLDDSPVNLATSSGLYIPQNYDKQFKGLVSMRTALGSSLNIPAVRTLVTVTPERFFRRLQSLGFNLRESGDYYGYSLALGSADVSLLSLTNAYRALANQGRYSSVRTTASDPRAAYQQAMDGSASFIVGDILSDRSARARTFGLESALSTRIWTAVKTGTSKDMRDNWCVGYSSRYTVGVWVGNASGAPMWDVSGVTGAAPVWQEVMQYLHRQSGSQEPSRPASVIAQPVQFENQLEAVRTEYFLPGTQQSLLRVAKSNDIAPTISYPTPGMLVAIDPDIPPAHQRLRFSAQGVKQGNWVLDGKPLVRAAGKKTGDLGYDWMPWPGKHKLILQDVNGAVLDQLQFEVRGALVRPPEGKAVKVKGTVAK
ncbi:MULTISPECIES: penicillin-binding protein 1C [unclassified Herbaspirillum]|nr:MULTISPECIES: penicillin-binding protein 1C [unclassified Herbaspirillum]RFB68852.1 penicillin-binding protein 1C [Herbaspirillum sp. 3R-3a1]TFI05758.1 penicillin-binding protein 1C [Herbaspirillum sp. 3R11]TFI13331.1 penicillin-binding protein 1C [Herbaspirillum sp. 3R-11]